MFNLVIIAHVVIIIKIIIFKLRIKLNAILSKFFLAPLHKIYIYNNLLVFLIKLKIL